MALFGLFGKKKKKAKLSKAQKRLLAQQEQLSALANEKATGLLNSSDADRQRAEQAAYDSLKLRLQPEFDRRRRSEETRLWNQGIAPTNDAYKTAINDFNLAEDDSWREAARQAVNMGQQSQNSTIGNVASLFGIGSPAESINTTMGIWERNQALKNKSNPLVSSLFKLGNTAVGGWASGGFKI